MTSFPRSPHILKAGLVLLDPISFKVKRVIALQYNPDQLTRTLQVQAVTGDPADRTEALRLKGPPVETFKLEAEMDATDQLEFPADHKNAVEVGVFPQLAVLESLVSPTADQIAAADAFLASGAVEIAPMESPLALFVWSAQRIVPVRVTEFSITEEAFDVGLNPTRAKVSLGLRVLSASDLPINHRGTTLFLAYLKNKEALARRFVDGSQDQLGVKGL
jgi:hypothetical protein